MSEVMRVPPNSLDAERAVLGGLLVEPTAMDLVADLPSDEFYGEANARIFEAMLALFGRSQPIDHTTLREELVRSGKLASIGGDEYLFTLTSTLPTVAHIEAHATIIREKASVRRLITACHEIVGKGYADYGDAASFLNEAESAVFTVSGSQGVDEGPRFMDAEGTIRRIQDVAEGRAAPGGLPTGLASLDHFTSGMYPGTMNVVAGRPGMGKSSLGLQMARASALKTRLPAIFFTLEMPQEQVEQRYLSMVASVDGDAIKKARLSPDHWSAIARAAQEMAEINLLIDYTPGITLAKVRSRARRVASKHGEGKLSALVIDYLQLMRGAGRSDSREQEVAEISRGMKELAAELHCPVVVLSQLNRKCEDRPDKRPQISDLRESGAIEQDADTIMLVYRRGVYAAQLARGEGLDDDPSGFGKRRKSAIEPGEDDGKAEIIVGKQRSGAPGTVRCLYEGPYTRFVDEPSQRNYPDTRTRGDWDDE